MCLNYLLLAWAPTLAWLFLGPAHRRRHRGQLLGRHRLHRRRDAAGQAGAALRPGRRHVRARLRRRPGAWRPARRHTGCACRSWPRPALAGVNVLYALIVLPESLPARPAPPVPLERRPTRSAACTCSTTDPTYRRLALRLVLHLVRARRAAEQLRAGQHDAARLGRASRTASRWPRSASARRWCRACWCAASCRGSASGAAALVGYALSGAGLSGLRLRRPGLDPVPRHRAAGLRRHQRPGGAVAVLVPRRPGPAGPHPGRARLRAGPDGDRGAAAGRLGVQRVRRARTRPSTCSAPRS